MVEIMFPTMVRMLVKKVVTVVMKAAIDPASGVIPLTSFPYLDSSPEDELITTSNISTRIQATKNKEVTQLDIKKLNKVPAVLNRNVATVMTASTSSPHFKQSSNNAIKHKKDNTSQYEAKNRNKERIFINASTNEADDEIIHIISPF